MRRPPGFLARVGRLPAALAELEQHPEGLRVADLAARVGADVEELREDLLAYYSADLPALIERGHMRPFTLDFFAAGTSGHDDDDEGVDPTEAEWVRVGVDSPLEEIGVTWLSAADAAALADAASAALELDPTDDALRSAVDRLHDLFLAGVREVQQELDDPITGTLRRACEERRRVRLTYSRAWRPGVVERTVDPYRLVRTGRGWELDAGPLDADRKPRTYLRSGIRAAEPLADHYIAPPGINEILDAARAEQRVLLRLPHHTRWVAEMYAERVAEVGEDRDAGVFEAWLLPPVRERVGLIVVTAGPGARVVEPEGLAGAAAETAAALLAAYGG